MEEQIGQLWKDSRVWYKMDCDLYDMERDEYKADANFIINRLNSTPPAGSDEDSSDISDKFSFTLLCPHPSILPSKSFQLFFLTWTQYIVNHSMN